MVGISVCDISRIGRPTTTNHQLTDVALMPPDGAHRQCDRRRTLDLPASLASNLHWMRIIETPLSSSQPSRETSPRRWGALSVCDSRVRGGGVVVPENEHGK